MGKTAIIVIIALLICFTFYCSKDEDETKGKIAAKKKKPLPVTPEIAKVEIDPPKPVSTDFIRAVPVLKHTGMRFVTYSYQWYVNGEPVPDSNKRLLAKTHFKKGDEVYCRVKAVRGKYESKVVESDEIKIGNAPPIVHSTPVSPFRVPGEFHYAIKASDPDGDALTYRLVSPQEHDIFINPDTGELEWYISKVPGDPAAGRDEVSPQPEDEETAAQREMEERSEAKPTAKPGLSPFVRIIFEVRDSGGATVTSSINLNLSKGTEDPK